MKTKANTEVIFKGFEDLIGKTYPEHEVITPQGLKSYTIRALRVCDEENLRGSVITPSKVARHLAETLWTCIVKKPDDVKTFTDFISKTTMKDRDALLFGLYVATYKNIQKYSVTCDKCNFANQIKVDVEKWFRAKSWLERGEGFTPILDYRAEVPLKVFQGVKVLLKAPTIKDEIEISESTAFDSEQMAAMKMTISMIDKFVIDPNEKIPNGDTIEERDNILSAFNSLTSPDRKIIEEAFEKEFSDYSISVKGKVRCTRCQNEREIDIDMSQQFFRALYE